MILWKRQIELGSKGNIQRMPRISAEEPRSIHSNMVAGQTFQEYLLEVYLFPNPPQPGTICKDQQSSDRFQEGPK
jgi:hypothetical protein